MSQNESNVAYILKKLSATKLAILEQVANRHPVKDSKAFRDLCAAKLVNPLCGEHSLPGHPVLTHLGANVLIGKVLAEEYNETPAQRAARRISALGMSEQTFDARLLSYFPCEQVSNTRNVVSNIDKGIWNPKD